MKGKEQIEFQKLLVRKKNSLLGKKNVGQRKFVLKFSLKNWLINMANKIYQIVCDVSSRQNIFTFCYYQPASDIRVAFRLMKERLRDYYGWKYVYLHYWKRVDKFDSYHYKIY